MTLFSPDRPRHADDPLSRPSREEGNRGRGKGSPLVSIIVTALDVPDGARRCVRTLYSSTPPCFETIVVDRASPAEAEGFPEGLRVITPGDAGAGLTRCVNEALPYCEGEFVCVLDGEVELLRGWLEPLLARAADDEVGPVGPLQLTRDGLVHHFGTVFRPDHAPGARLPRPLHRGCPPDRVVPLSAREYPAMDLSCCLWRGDVLKRLGGPASGPPSPRAEIGEDLMLRARASGYRNVFEPRSVVIRNRSCPSRGPGGSPRPHEAIQAFAERWKDAPPVLFQVLDYDSDLPPEDTALVRVRENGEAIDVTALLRSKRRELEGEKKLLTDARESRRADGDEPLVSVLIPTYDNAELLTGRTLPSVLGQTYPNIEVIVVGDCCADDTAERVAGLEDGRIRFVNLPERGRYPDDPMSRWRVAGSVPANVAIEMACGSWLAPLDDDDEFYPDHVEVLLRAALSGGHEMIYGKVLMEHSPGRFEELGEFPPGHARLSRMSALYRADIGFFKYDTECWKLEEPGDWNMWRRMNECGVRIGFVDRVVGVHYLERTRLDR